MVSSYDPLINPIATRVARISSSCAAKAIKPAEVEKPKPPDVAVVRVNAVWAEELLCAVPVTP
jgi:hypothetical protein